MRARETGRKAVWGAGEDELSIGEFEYHSNVILIAFEVAFHSSNFLTSLHWAQAKRYKKVLDYQQHINLSSQTRVKCLVFVVFDLYLKF